MNRFDVLAKEWDSNPERVKSAMIFADAVKDSLNCNINNFNVLDYGCGSGLVSFAFANDVKEIEGLDNSIAMIDVYNNKAKMIGLNNIFGKLNDINKDHIESNKYDLILTNMTMHHINDAESFISKLANGLKVNGKLFVADLYTEDGTFHSDNNDVIHFGFKKENILEAFKKAGLKNIHIKHLQTICKTGTSYKIFIASGGRI